MAFDRCRQTCVQFSILQEALFLKMKRHFLSFIYLLISGFLPLLAQDITMSLNGNDWSVRNPYDRTVFPGKVPGNIFTDLMAQDLIPDPYTGDNEYYVQWVSDRVWIYEKEVIVDPSLISNMLVRELVLEGVEGYSKVFWNNEFIGSCDNAFKPFYFDLRDKVKASNKLRIVFEHTGNVEREKEEIAYPLPGGSRVYTRKPAYHYGWDWGPRLNGVGIGSASLQAWTGVRIEHSMPVVDTITHEALGGTGVFQVRSSLSALLHLNVFLDGKKVVTGHAVRVQPGRQEVRVPFNVKAPRLWWTWDLGNPYLYDVRVEMEYLSDDPLIELFSGQYESTWGLRQTRIVTEKDSTGSSFYIELNGVPVFTRGANYIPQDLFTNRVRQADYDALLDQVVKSNINALRVWGGGIYEKDRFYNLCDSLGVLVWQDFMFACGMYPGDDGFLHNVREEAIYQVKRLSGHPSLLLWCGNNENAEGWARWGWQENYSDRQRSEVEAAYQRLFHDLLPEIVKDHSGNIPYWPSSPLWGRGDTRFDKEGDAHDWGVWHDGMPFERFEERVPRFMSEYGFQSWPSYSVARDFMREGGKMSAATHQKHPRGFDIMENYRARNFSAPQNFLDTIYISQLVQARGMVIGAESHRLARPYCMGSLYWQLNDCWPSISWSGIDNHGYWKAMQAYIRQAFEPVMYTLKSDGNTLELWGVNDTRKRSEDTIKLTWWENGVQQLNAKTIIAELPPGNAKVLEKISVLGILENADSSKVMVTLEVAGKEDHRVFLLVRPINYNGVHAPLEWVCKTDGDEKWLTLFSKAVHTSIYLPPEILVDQSDNFPTILPGRPVRIKVRSCPDYMRSFPFNVIRRSGFGDL